jgi:tyrosine-protein kinase Etk/Wzc
LQTRVKLFPSIGAGWARLTGEKPNTIAVSRFYVPIDSDDDVVKAKITIIDPSHYILFGDGFELKGNIGELVSGEGFQ